jgi:hypothetical protein
MDPYMAKTDGLLRQGRARLDRLRAKVEKTGAGANVVHIDEFRRIRGLEIRYAGLGHMFDQLRAPGAQGVADLKVRLEKAWDAFQFRLGGSR